MFDLFEHFVECIDQKSDLIVISFCNSKGIIFFDGDLVGRQRQLCDRFRDY